MDTLSQIEQAQGAEGALPSARTLFPFWYEAAEPFRVIGPIHFVGSRGLSMFFIPTEDGHILIDGGVPENAPMVASSIRELGYDPKDIKVLLNTHAHLDHSGGLAELKALSGAKLIASEGDRSALEGGFYLGSEDRPDFNSKPVDVDEIIADGETVSLGGITLTAHITPGHTRGCTSWTLDVDEAGQTYSALVFCSASVAANRLAGPPQYAGIVEDYRRTFEITRDWRPDVFLSNHPEFYGHASKAERLESGDPLAFVDPDGFPAFISKMEAGFEAALERQSP
ncbi:MAG: subclass B3 metallo-beta-lactamase [Pseudomonadota bacterium]